MRIGWNECGNEYSISLTNEYEYSIQSIKPQQPMGNGQRETSNMGQQNEVVYELESSVFRLC